MHEIWLPGISNHQATKRCFNASTSFNSGMLSNNKLCNYASVLGNIICLELHLAMWRRELLQEGSLDGASGLLKRGAEQGSLYHRYRSNSELEKRAVSWWSAFFNVPALALSLNSHSCLFINMK